MAVAARPPLGGADHVPQPDPRLAQRGEPVGIGKRRERTADHRAEQAPELVGRMRIILAFGQRPRTGQAAENQKARVGCDVRREAGVAGGGHAPVATGRISAPQAAWPLTRRGITARGAPVRKPRTSVAFESQQRLNIAGADGASGGRTSPPGSFAVIRLAVFCRFRWVSARASSTAVQ